MRITSKSQEMERSSDKWALDSCGTNIKQWSSEKAIPKEVFAEESDSKKLQGIP